MFESCRFFYFVKLLNPQAIQAVSLLGGAPSPEVGQDQAPESREMDLEVDVGPAQIFRRSIN